MKSTVTIPRKKIRAGNIRYLKLELSQVLSNDLASERLINSDAPTTVTRGRMCNVVQEHLNAFSVVFFKPLLLPTGGTS